MDGDVVDYDDDDDVDDDNEEDKDEDEDEDDELNVMEGSWQCNTPSRQYGCGCHQNISHIIIIIIIIIIL